MYRGRPHNQQKTMDFKLHQLSGSNLKSIFNNAYIEAEILNNSEFCVIKGDRTLCVIAFQEQKILEFSNMINFPTEFSVEDIQKFVNAVNEEMVMLKAYIYKDSEDGRLSVFLKYSHVILDHENISAKTIIKLSRMMEDHCNATCYIFENIFQRK